MVSGFRFFFLVDLCNLILLILELNIQAMYPADLSLRLLLLLDEVGEVGGAVAGVLELPDLLLAQGQDLVGV